MSPGSSKTAGRDDQVREEAEKGYIIDADEADKAYKFPVVKKEYLPFHFADGIFDGHKIDFTLLLNE
jgi:hypothetical protein